MHKIKENLVLLAALFIVLNSWEAAGLNSANNSEANLTIWDSTDSGTWYNDDNVFFYANFTNWTTDETVYGDDIYCNISFNHIDAYFNMTLNDTDLLYFYNSTISTAASNYTVICDGLEHGIVNVSDNASITNRAPVNDVAVPNVSMLEDSSNVTINMTDYFFDTDGHELNYSVAVEDGNLTAFVDNDTKLLNITPIRDFYGSRTLNITAFDGFGGNNTSNNVNVSVSNQIEVNLSVPVSDASGFTVSDTFNILATVEDDYNVTSCSLLVNGSVNETVVPDIGVLAESKNDDGSSNTFQRVGKDSPHGILTKQLNISDTDVKFLAFYVQTTGSPSNMNVSINNNFFTNITADEIIYSCSSEPCWIYKPLDTSLLTTVTNNISFDGTYVATDYWRIQVDTGTDNGMSYNSVSGDITGEYMVRFHNVTNIVNFSNMQFSKGNYNWNVNCTNNQSISNTAVNDFNFTVQNTAPTTPTVSPNSGTYDEEINISCLSTDADGDDITYDVQYYDVWDSSNVITLSEDDSDGNYTWNTSLYASDSTVILKCVTSDGTNTSSGTSPYITISHPGAPSVPTNLSCHEGRCNLEFNNTVNLTGYGSNDSNSNFSYYFYATYDDVNGTESYFVGEAAGLNSTLNNGTYVWNITLIPYQESVTVEVLAYDGLYNSSRFNLTNQLIINNTDSPSVPLNISPMNGTFLLNQTLNISCNGSSDSNGDDLNYSVFVLYDDTWTLLNSTLNNTTFFLWNWSNVAEQTINLSCQASDGKYVSPLLRTGGINLVREPTDPINLTPANDTVHEYELNYSCAGSNNSDFFEYAVWLNYTNDSVSGYRLLNDSFPGVLPVNDSDLKYDDEVYSGLSHGGSVGGYRQFSTNVSNFDYTACINAYGTNTQFKLYYDCDIGISCTTINVASNCDASTSAQILDSTETEYCYNITLNKSGNKAFCIETNSPSSSATATSYIDSVILTAKPLTFNTTNITPQNNVQIQCYAHDETGNSSAIINSNLIIDRKPVYNSSSSVSITSGSSTTLNMSALFYDPDDDNMTFGFINYSSALGVSYNENTTILTIEG